MQKKRVLIFSILNLIATFLPYGLIEMKTNYFLWNENKISDLYADGIREVIDGINTFNTIAIYVIAIALVISSIIYFKSEKKVIETVTKYLSIVSVCVNLFFCYHIFEPGECKYINIGVMLSIAACTYIVTIISEFDTKTLLVLGTAHVITFPTLVQMYSDDIEAAIEPIYCSVQVYFYMLYDNIIHRNFYWLITIPSMMVVFFTLKSVIYILSNNENKIKSVKNMRNWYVVAFGLEIALKLVSKETMYIVPTYPIAIAMIVTYLCLDKRSKGK